MTAPQPGPAAPTHPQRTNVLMNYWLSVFFAWIPALIFFLIDRDKDQPTQRYHAENLNFSLLRTIVSAGTGILSFVPIVGSVLAVIGFLAGAVLFVFHIIAAVKATNSFPSGQPEFIFNIPMVKA